MTPQQIARRKRQQFERDMRPRWDDPDLCVYTKAGVAKPAHLLTEFCRAELQRKDELWFPSWRNDDTYFMGKTREAAKPKPKKKRAKRASKKAVAARCK